MKTIAKAIRANKLRVTRFHTERGRLMPFSAWLRIPQVVWARLASAGSKKPWMVPAAVAYLSRTIKSDWNVFEFGSGWSTVWYAERSARVVSVEHNPIWYKLTCQMLSDRGIRNCDLGLIKATAFPQRMESFEDNMFDLVIVDGTQENGGDRLRCVAASTPKVKPGGYLVLDDSDRAVYRGADLLLPGWAVQRFIGVKPFPLMAVETSVYRRPLYSQDEAVVRYEVNL